MVNSGRYCMRCGGRLSRDSRTNMCAPCRQLSGVGSDNAPDLGPDFWYTDLMRDAFASKDMGAIVRAYRFHPAHGHKPLPQATVSRWLGTVGQSQLSRIESGLNRVDTYKKMVHYARALKMPPDLLWFELPDTDSDLPPAADGVFMLPDGPVVAATSMRTGSALADSLLKTLDAYSATDNLIGPQSLVGVVPQQVRFIDELLVNTKGKDRTRLLFVGARYAEFAGWVYQDAGALDSAMQMSMSAFDYVQELGDEMLASYILMRRSNIASDAGRPELAVKLASAALANSGRLSSRQHAVALRQLAFSYALLGDADNCGHALDTAFSLSDRGVDSADDLANYCTTGYLEMEAAHCWVELGKPDRAVPALQHGLAAWQPEYRRDLGLCLARLSVAHASCGQVEHALTVADRALHVASETHSFRTETQLGRIPDIISKIGAIDEARRFDRQIKSLRRDDIH